MSSAAISFVSSPNSLSLTHVFPTKTNPIFSCRVHSFKTQSLRSFFSRIPIGCFKQSSFFTSSNPFSPVMKWQDCSVKMEIDVPASVAYNLYSDREAIPNWMPFVSSVKVLEDKPELSRWFVKYEAFGRSIEYSWLAKNLQLSISYEVPQLLIPVASVSVLFHHKNVVGVEKMTMLHLLFFIAHD
ncbi:uncharacterized protein LOC120136762 isoform X5 [Hibiscus syriacus]|uniref:uncharacterized protein LOC120136762 isoform X5 n=1 Tax=Hibiscus syriacus TaxID=106335 RepID=UPI001923E781|nr:uncharacterized protein LOC120136762 isoform X5 [Hibiscus syriacus]